jgi:hypothetical protein
MEHGAGSVAEVWEMERAGAAVFLILFLFLNLIPAALRMADEE